MLYATNSLRTGHRRAVKRMTEKRPTVFIVDDDEGSRQSVKALARSMGVDAETFESAEGFLKAFDASQHGCLITDLRMLGMSGLELQEKLAADGITLPVIIITAHAETPLTVRAVKSCAITVLEKPCRDYELVDAIRAALAEDARRRLHDEKQMDFLKRLESLTDHEQTVLDLMIEGIANKVIANRLDVSIRTVENRRQRIFEKTGTKSLAELIKRVVEVRGDLSD